MEFRCCEDSKKKNRLKDTVSFLKVISEENRLKIMCLLQKQEMCVCDIWECLNLPQNLVSHHLKVLKDFGLVDSRRESTKVIYCAKQKEIKKYSDLLAQYLKQ